MPDAANNPAPSAAARIRSALHRPGSPTLALDQGTLRPSLWRLLPDGALALLLDAGSPAPQPAVLELADQLSLPARQPIRALAWITGLLEPMPDAEQRSVALAIAEERPHPGLLEVGHGTVLARLRPLTAVLVDTHAATAVSAAELLAAAPDPFCLLEEAWLAHLEDSHPELLQGLRRRLPSDLRGRHAEPLSIDRWGVCLRVHTSETTTTDVRLPFSMPADSPFELGCAVRAIAGAPFRSGLRARHDAA